MDWLPGASQPAHQQFEGTKRGRKKNGLESRIAPWNPVRMTAAAYAILGAIAGIVIVLVGPRFHIGSWFFDGVPGYVGAACAGAFVALLVRNAVRQTFGPVIP
jgi:hypothetical protein